MSVDGSCVMSAAAAGLIDFSNGTDIGTSFAQGALRRITPQVSTFLVNDNITVIGWHGVHDPSKCRERQMPQSAKTHERGEFLLGTNIMQPGISCNPGVAQLRMPCFWQFTFRHPCRASKKQIQPGFGHPRKSCSPFIGSRFGCISAASCGWCMPISVEMTSIAAPGLLNESSSVRIEVLTRRRGIWL